jgi:hypothetical protein
MNIWELRKIREDLAKDSKAAVDEDAIFETYERMRERVAAAIDLTKAARREEERKRLHKAQPRVSLPVVDHPIVAERPREAVERLPAAAPMRKYADLRPFETEEL